eukprot:scaffold3378_cov104-Cylindrotheca_fusiformis.AAC.1
MAASAKLILTGLPLVHISLTMASLGLGLYGVGRSKAATTVAVESFDARHYNMVTEMVTKMYAGRGAAHTHHCKLAESVTFEDPAAICKSPKEVLEAFRVFEMLQPQSLDPPKCIHVEPKGSSIALTYALHQRYRLLSVDLRSHLVLNVQLIPIKDLPESEFLVLRMEERWNGIPLPNSPLFWITRRINGIVSWYLTTTFLVRKT